MKGLITGSKLAFCLGVGMSVLAGCNCYRSLVDPCWPERYASEARQSVRDMGNAQAEKGHILDQTIWNWMFDPDPKGLATATLNSAGIEQLKLISRRLPTPDTQIYLQTAQDIPYRDGVAPDKLVAQREEMNHRRAVTVQRFLATQMTSGPAAYQVAVHDFAPSGIIGTPIVGTKVPPAQIQGAYEKHLDHFSGKLPNIQSISGSSINQ